MRLSEAIKTYEKNFDADRDPLEENHKRALRAVLEAAGVELAPEPEPLPDFWGERLKVDEYGCMHSPTKRVEFRACRGDGQRNRRALALSHSLRVAATELVREETREDGYPSVACTLTETIRRLRRILLHNELPEADS